MHRKILIALIIFFGITTTVYAAPYYRQEATILPIADSAYDLGTTTKAWRNFYVDQICFSADTCETAWPLGGGGGGGSEINWSWTQPKNLTWLSTTTNQVAIGVNSTTTSTVSYPLSKLIVLGGAVFTNATSTGVLASDKYVQAPYFTATSSTVASTFPLATIDTLTLTNDLTVANGGTGASTLTGLLQGNGTGAITGITNSSTVGQILRVTGASTYAWGALNLDDTDAFTGTLPNTALENSSVTVNGTAISLGSSGTITAASSTLLANDNTFSGNNTFSNTITFDGVTGNQWSDFCTSITGGAGLCDGTDATGGAGGSDVNWTFTNGSLLYPSTSTNSVVINGTATTTNTNLQVIGTTTSQSLGVGSTAIGSNVLKVSNLTGLTTSNSESVGGVFNLNTGTTDTIGMALYNNHTGTNRLLSLVCDAATYGGNCFHVRSDGTESAFNIIGATTGKGVGKLSHATVGDADASILSLDATSAGYLGQGIFIDCTGGSCDSTNNVLSIANHLGQNGSVLTAKWGGNIGFGTTSPYTRLGVAGTVVADNFVATSTILASSFQQASTTMLTVSGNQYNTGLTSAIVLTGANGLMAEYTGTACLTQFISSLSALGVATCADVSLTDDISGTLQIVNGGTARTTVGASSTVAISNGTGYNFMATSTLGLQSPITLTTTGTSGASTFDGVTLNIPQYTGSLFPFTPSTNYGALTNATGTPVWFQSGLQASSTSHFVQASTTNLTVSNKLYAPVSGSIVLSATSTMGTGTTTLKVSGFSQDWDFTELGCTSQGSGTFNVQIGDSTSSSTLVVSGTSNTTTFTTLSSNNSFTRGEAFWIDFGGVSGSVSVPSCSYTRVTR